jgi:hypothetical protein
MLNHQDGWRTSTSSWLTLVELSQQNSRMGNLAVPELGPFPIFDYCDYKVHLNMRKVCGMLCNDVVGGVQDRSSWL